MLFHVTWEFIDPSEEGARRSLAVFQSWQPAPGNEFKGNAVSRRKVSGSPESRGG